MTKKDIVKYNNDFNIANLTDLDKVEIDIFMTICSKFTEHKTDRLEFTYDEIRNSAKLVEKKYSKERFKQFMLSTQSKILKINFSVNDGKGYRQRPLFREFYTPHAEETVFIQLDDLFLNYLYNIPEKIAFTQFELDAFLHLKSKYAKTLLRFLLQNFTGTWVIDFEEFKKKMGFPKSQYGSQCLRTLDKALEELEQSPLLSDICYEIEKARTKGNPIKKIFFKYKISSYTRKELQGQQKFDFVKVTSETQVYDVVDVPASNQRQLYDDPVIISMQKVKKAEICPLCGADIIEKVDANGRSYRLCNNNRFWKLGTQSCDWREYVDDNK